MAKASHVRTNASLNICTTRSLVNIGPVWTQYTPSNEVSISLPLDLNPILIVMKAIMLLNSTGTSMKPDDYRKKQIDFINSNPAVWHHRRSLST